MPSRPGLLNALAVALLAASLVSCSSPPGGGAPSAAQSANVDKSVGRNLATLDAYCWRIELNKNTDYSVWASASGTGIAGATVQAQGTNWAAVLGRAVSDLKADMTAKGITPEAAMTRQGSRTFSEAEVEMLHNCYQQLDRQAWYVKGTKSRGWTILCKADLGQASDVTVFSEGTTLVGTLNEALRKLEGGIAQRAGAR